MKVRGKCARSTSLAAVKWVMMNHFHLSKLESTIRELHSTPTLQTKAQQWKTSTNATTTRPRPMATATIKKRRRWRSWARKRWRREKSRPRSSTPRWYASIHASHPRTHSALIPRTHPPHSHLPSLSLSLAHFTLSLYPLSPARCHRGKRPGARGGPGHPPASAEYGGHMGRRGKGRGRGAR